MQIELSRIVSIAVIVTGIGCLAMTAAGNLIGHHGIVSGAVLILGGVTRLWMNRQACSEGAN